VLLSVLLCPPPHLCRPAVLTAWAAVAVCAVVEQTAGRSPRIKWPNDVLLEGRKVCGILLEGRGAAATTESRPAHVVVGIGLNVRQSDADFAAADLPDATSLARFTPTPPETKAVAVDLIRRLDEDYDRLCRGDLATLEASWRVYLGLLGEPVVAECPGATHRGGLRELTFAGVVLERPDAAPLVLTPERILHLRRADGPDAE
jgi:BirA family biotin operon repressor/biotin-[acetyl-CoA-carboxylase] ligase